MFTGIVEELGVIEDIFKQKQISISVRAEKISKDIKIGDSVAVDGVCLTVTALNKFIIFFDIMQETYNNTCLKHLRKKQVVNCELAATLSTRLGGHLVSGHVDTVGMIDSIRKLKNYYGIIISVDKKFSQYILPKGSVAVNGISLTVQKVLSRGFEVGIIPHTLKNTSLAGKKERDYVNIEFDMLAKHVENILSVKNKQQSERLKKLLRG